MAEEQIDPREAQDLFRFQVSYNRRSNKSTWALAIVIAAMYLLEELFGGSKNVAVLVRMGANVGELVHSGEYFRLLTSVFLHGGFLHVALNTYVFFALGSFFNRILGESRYLTVFFVSGLTGSLASVFFGKAGVSVGASGAIWGLFGASLALAVFKTSFIPETVRLQLRRATVINLVINLGISFLPMIDIWAHVGGGLGGFLVSLVIIFTSSTRSSYRLSGYFFRALAVMLALSYGSAIAYVMWTYKPWVDQFTLNLVTADLPEVGMSIAIPEGLKITTGDNSNAKSAYYIFGDFTTDRLVVEVHFFHEEVLGKKPDQEWLMTQRTELLSESVPAQVKKSVYFRESNDGGLLYYQQPTKNADVVVHNYVVTRMSYAIKISLLTASETPQAKVDELGKKIVTSLVGTR